MNKLIKDMSVNGMQLKLIATRYLTGHKALSLELHDTIYETASMNMAFYGITPNDNEIYLNANIAYVPELVDEVIKAIGDPEVPPQPVKVNKTKTFLVTLRPSVVQIWRKANG